MLDIPFLKLHPDAQLPAKDEGNIGWDIHCVADEAVGWDNSWTLLPGQRKLFHTGFSAAIPHGYAALLWDRSGLSTKHGLHRLAGVIDSSYRGEWLVCLVNLGEDVITVSPGDKIIQAILQQEIKAELRWADSLDETIRGAKGFGSSGL